MKLMIRKSLYDEIMKSISNQNKLQYFKNELIRILERQEAEENRISKSYGVGKLSTYADGSVWRKVSSNPSKWKMVRGPKNYNTESHGAKIVVGKLKKEIQSCNSYAELFSIVVANKNRFVDDSGRYLPIVKELMVKVNKTHSKMKKNKTNNISLDEKNYLQDFKDLEYTFGTNYKDYKGKETEAVYKLMNEKKGFVRGAYYRNDLGELDLVWGKITNPIKHTGMGLIHIFDKHKEITPEDITRIVNKGKLIKTYNGYNLVYENYILGINHGWKRNGKLIAKNDWIVTSFEKKEDKKTTTIAHADNFTSETISSQNLSKKIRPSQNNSVNKNDFVITSSGIFRDKMKDKFEKVYPDYSSQAASSNKTQGFDNSVASHGLITECRI